MQPFSRIIMNHHKNNLQAAVIAFALALSISNSFAQDITTCVDPEGMAYYHHSGSVSAKDAGWSKDKITDGRLTLKKIADNEYDIFILDATKSLFSLRQDGGQIVLMRAGDQDATFLHFFPGKVIELYTFWRDTKGEFRYDLVQSKGGATTRVHKSAVLVGTCSAIKFDLLR